MLEDSITDEDIVSDGTAVDDAKDEMLLLTTTLVDEADSDRVAEDDTTETWLDKTDEDASVDDSTNVLLATALDAEADSD